MPVKQISQQDPLTILALNDWFVKDNNTGTTTEKFTPQDLINFLLPYFNSVQFYDTVALLRLNTNYSGVNPGKIFIVIAVPGVSPAKLYRFVAASVGVDDGTEGSYYVKPSNILIGDPGRYEQQL